MPKMVNILSTADILATKVKCSSMTSRSLFTEPNALGLVRVKCKPKNRASYMARSFLSAEGLGARSVKSAAYARAPTKIFPKF